MEKLVMIPGPTPVVRSIQDQMGRPIMAMNDPEFVKEFKWLIDELNAMFNCDGKTFILNGSGTLAMEMAMANVTKRGDRILVVSNGFFGDRFNQIAAYKGLVVDLLQAEWGKIVPLSEIKQKLESNTYAAVFTTHVDTSTGVCFPIAELGAILKAYPDIIYIVDGVCATAGIKEDLTAMNIDILLTCTQKAFGVPPGLMMLWASQKALKRREALGSIAEYYIDFKNWLPVMENPMKFFSTPAVNLVWALKEGVRLIKEEGLEARYARHDRNGKAAQAAFEALGFSLLAEKDHRAPTLSNVIYPEGIDDASFRAKVAENGVLIAGGLGPYAGKMFRMGHMGNATKSDILTALTAIEKALKSFGKIDHYGIGQNAFLQALE